MCTRRSPFTSSMLPTQALTVGVPVPPAIWTPLQKNLKAPVEKSNTTKLPVFVSSCRHSTVPVGGQVGGQIAVPLTVTVNWQLAVLPDGSFAVQVTVLVPVLKFEPEPTGPLVAPDDVQLKVAPEQLSVAVMVNGTDAEHAPAPAVTVIGPGQVICGFCVSLTATVKLQLGPAVVVQLTVVVPVGKQVP